MKALDAHPIRNTVVAKVWIQGGPDGGDGANSAVVKQLYETAKECSQSLGGITSAREAQYQADGSINVLRYSGMSSECTISADHIKRSLVTLPSTTHNGTVTGVVYRGPTSGGPAKVIPSFR